MFYSKRVTASLLALALGVMADSINNLKEMASLESQAVLLVEGDYTITNVATNQTITYIQEGQNWFPSDDDDNAAITTFYQNPTGPYMRLSSNGQLQKCVSAQWGYDEAGPGIGADHAGVLYTCAVGPGADPHSTVEKPKQWWLFVPVNTSSTTTNLQTDVVLQDTDATSGGQDNSTTVCKKPRDWIRRHPLYVNGPKYHHTECAAYLTHSQAIALNMTVEAGFASNSTNSDGKKNNKEKRSLLSRRRLQTRAANDNNSGDVNGGTFYIIALDHLHDMETRALVGKMTLIPGGAKGTVMDPWDANELAQQWTVTPVN